MVVVDEPREVPAVARNDGAEPGSEEKSADGVLRPPPRDDESDGEQGELDRERRAGVREAQLMGEDQERHEPRDE